MSRFVFSASVKAAVRRGLDLREQQPKSQRATLSHAQARAQGIVSGLTTARKILNDTMGEEDVKRLLRYHSRHAKNMALDAGKKPVEDKGYVAGLIWGGRGAAGEARQMMRRLEKATGAKTPAPPRDRVFGSKRNKRGSAATTRGGIKVDPATEKALRNKLEALKDSKHKIDLGTLKAVYRRGAGAFSTSHRPGMGRNQWSMGRVNAFIRLLQTGKRKPAYTTDLDLLPSSHPQSTRKSLGAATLLKGSGALDGAVKWYRVPGWLARALRAAQLAKGAGHKYVKRVPTGKFTKTGKPRYRYYYAVHHGAGVVGHEDELKRGAAFKLTHNGQDGHFHIIGVDGDKLRIRHDETGHVAVVEKSALQAMLREHHAEAIGQAKKKARETHEAAQKFGSAKQKARARKRAEKIGAIEDKPKGHKNPDIKKALEAFGKLAGAREAFEKEPSIENLVKLSEFVGSINAAWEKVYKVPRWNEDPLSADRQATQFFEAFGVAGASKDHKAEIKDLVKEYGRINQGRLSWPRLTPDSLKAALRLNYLSFKHEKDFKALDGFKSFDVNPVEQAVHHRAGLLLQTYEGVDGCNELLRARKISVPNADRFKNISVDVHPYYLHKFSPVPPSVMEALPHGFFPASPKLIQDAFAHQYKKDLTEYKARHKRNIARVKRVLKKLKANLPPEKIQAALSAGDGVSDLVKKAGGRPGGVERAKNCFSMITGPVTDGPVLPYSKEEDPLQIVKMLSAVDEKVLPEAKKFVLGLFDKRGRASCESMVQDGEYLLSFVKIYNKSDGDDPAVAWHEFGHALEDKNPGIAGAAHALRDERGKRSTKELLFGRDDEETFADEWADPYTGRWYGVNIPNTANRNGTEILSMGVQEMFADAGAFLKQDEQHFYFTLAALSGRLNKRGS